MTKSHGIPFSQLINKFGFHLSQRFVISSCTMYVIMVIFKIQYVILLKIVFLMFFLNKVLICLEVSIPRKPVFGNVFRQFWICISSLQIFQPFNRFWHTQLTRTLVMKLVTSRYLDIFDYCILLQILVLLKSNAIKCIRSNFIYVFSHLQWFNL